MSEPTTFYEVGLLAGRMLLESEGLTVGAAKKPKTVAQQLAALLDELISAINQPVAPVSDEATSKSFNPIAYSKALMQGLHPEESGEDPLLKRADPRWTSRNGHEDSLLRKARGARP